MDEFKDEMDELKDEDGTVRLTIVSILVKILTNIV
jgi:hypothetical protein